MIKIKVQEENNNFKNITISGHAMYDDYGKDIVCASVSSIVITTVNAIISIDKDSIKYQNKDNLIIEIIKTDDVINKLINNMIDLLQELRDQYPNNIKFL